ncbi:MAG: hypothetical protein KDK08_05185 [Rhizobiaceae bacterium]|nr:hypothetical protein [Rhizobiaceae bacterium]MCC0000863.1 hypothetical protein [Methylobacteriaceae bacterium]
MELHPITASMVKALGYLAAAQKRPVKPKVSYADDGAYLILRTSRSCMTSEQVKLADAGLVNMLPRKMVAVFPARREVAIDSSKYSGAALREIRKSGQKRECARRLMRMNANAAGAANG